MLKTNDPVDDIALSILSSINEVRILYSDEYGVIKSNLERVADQLQSEKELIQIEDRESYEHVKYESAEMHKTMLCEVFINVYTNCSIQNTQLEED